MPRVASAGSTVVPDQWSSYYRSGIFKFRELHPYAVGGALASQFTRAAAVNNPVNSSGWRKPSAYSGTLIKYEQKWYRFEIMTYALHSCDAFFQTPIPSLSGLSTFPLFCEDDLARARNKALLSLKDQTVNLSLAFKERQKTVGLVTDAVNNAVGVIKRVKQILHNPTRLRALRSQLKGKWKEVPEAWLLYRYGIVPTMLDAYGAVEALEKRDNGSYERYRVTVRGKSTTVLPPKLISHKVVNYGRYYTVPNTVIDRWMLGSKYGARVRYDAALTNSTYLRLSEVGVTNPLEVAWELISFSFVVDWFLSVGDWCKALDATLPFTFIGGSETKFVDWSGETRVLNPNVFKISDSGPSTHKQFVRSTVGGFPSASPLVLKKNPLNFTRLADALSLLASLAEGSRPIKR